MKKIDEINLLVHLKNDYAFIKLCNMAQTHNVRKTKRLHKRTKKLDLNPVVGGDKMWGRLLVKFKIVDQNRAIVISKQG